MGYSKAKWPILGLNLKVPNHGKKDSRNTLKFFYEENASRKRVTFEK